MLKISFPNEKLYLYEQDIESALNRGRQQPLSYTFDFDVDGRARAVYREGAFYYLSTRDRTCSCPAHKFNDDCKHLHAARTLESRVQIIICPDCKGYGADEESECNLCGGLGRIYRLASPQEKIPARG